MAYRTGVFSIARFIILLVFISAPVRAEEYIIGPEDVLDITVWRQENLSKTVTVSEEGAFDYPLLGEITASGLTPKQLSDLIRQELAKSYIQNPRVTVIVKEYNSHKVMIFGEVNAPGMYKLKGDTTLLELLARVGGVTSKGKGEGSVLILREENKTVTTKGGKVKTVVEKVPIKIDLYALLYKGDISCNVQIRAGDILYVSSESGNRVYILGQVNAPGPYEVGENVTVMEAVKLAGGFTEIAAPNRIKIIRENNNPSKDTQSKEEINQNKKQSRRRRDWREKYRRAKVTDTGDSRTYGEAETEKQEAQKEIIKVSVKKIMKGDSSQDIVLQAEDIIVVPERLF